jgi:dihydrofolate reductase
LELDHSADNVFVIKEKPIEVIKSLKKETGTPIYLCGGGDFAGFLLEHQLIDELILKHNPVIFGKGIKLFGMSTAKIDLSLEQTKVYDNGVLLLTYQINY